MIFSLSVRENPEDTMVCRLNRTIENPPCSLFKKADSRLMPPKIFTELPYGGYVAWVSWTNVITQRQSEQSGTFSESLSRGIEQLCDI